MADTNPISPPTAALAAAALSSDPVDPASAASSGAATAFLATCSPATLALHADHALRQSSDVAPPIHLSTTFWYPSDADSLVPAADASHAYPPDVNSHIYTRYSNPNASRLESLLSALIGAPSLSYTSGLSATHAIYVLLRPRRVFITDGYHGVHRVLALLHRLCPTHYTSLPVAEAAAQAGPGDVIHVETPLNPTGEARDVAAAAALAHARQAYVVVDATLGPPPLQDPFARGADIVLHSGTKYLGGHSDLLLGVLATRRADWLASLAADRVVLGAVPGSMESWLASRSLRTVAARVARQSAAATQLVAWLHNALEPKAPIVGAVAAQDPATPASGVTALRAVLGRVHHSSVQAAADPAAAGWIAEQMPTGGASPVFALTATGERFARRLPGSLHLFAHATSLGGVESLIEWRAMSDPGVDRCLLRVSVGLEDAEDLWRDLVQGCEVLVREKRVE